MSHATADQTTIPQVLRHDAITPREPSAASACCGGPAPTGTDACCVRDAEVKSTGEAGCGCGSAPQTLTVSKTACCG